MRLQPCPKRIEISYRAVLSDPTLLREAAESVHELILQKLPNVKYIAVRGTSGSAVAFALSFAYGYKVCYVRKEGESTHGRAVENPPSEPYVIVDDFIASGGTVGRIIAAISQKPAAIILYGTGSGQWSWHGEVPIHYTRTYSRY